MKDSEVIAKALQDKEPVDIYRNNDTGERLYAISLVSIPGFWLNAFKTKEDALEFCSSHGLPIEMEDEVEAELRRDRALYGNSFELNGERIDPRRVVLNPEKGTYKILEDK